MELLLRGNASICLMPGLRSRRSRHLNGLSVPAPGRSGRCGYTRAGRIVLVQLRRITRHQSRGDELRLISVDREVLRGSNAVIGSPTTSVQGDE